MRLRSWRARSGWSRPTPRPVDTTTRSDCSSGWSTSATTSGCWPRSTTRTPGGTRATSRRPSHTSRLSTPPWTWPPLARKGSSGLRTLRGDGLPDVVDAGADRQHHGATHEHDGDPPDCFSDRLPEAGEHAQRDDQQPERQGLQRGLELPAATCRHHHASADEPDPHERDAQLANEHDHRDPPPQLAYQRETDEGHAGQRLVRDRVGDLAEVRDQVVLAREVAVDLVRDRGEREEDVGNPTPAGRVAVVDQQGPSEEGHHEDPQRRERIGDVPVARRCGEYGVVALVVGHRTASATRSAPAVSTTTASTRSPIRAWNRGSVVVPSTSGPWCSARPSTPSVTDSTMTVTRSPMRPSARWVVSSSTSALSVETRAAISSSSSFPSYEAASVPSSSE